MHVFEMRDDAWHCLGKVKMLPPAGLGSGVPHNAVMSYLEPLPFSKFVTVQVHSIMVSSVVSNVVCT